MITIKEARKKLGKKSEGMKDEEIQNILNFLYNLSERIIDNTVTSLPNKNAN